MSNTIVILAIIGAFSIGIWTGYAISLRTITDLRKLADTYFKMLFRQSMENSKLKYDVAVKAREPVPADWKPSIEPLVSKSQEGFDDE